MKTYQFNREKNKNGILMELGKIEDTSNFDFSSQVHCADFFEILIFRNGNGYIHLDSQKIKITNSQFLFISPYQKRRWFVDKTRIKGYFLIFEIDFLNDFFADKLFIYRLQYFYNNSVEKYFIPNKKLFSFENDIFSEIIEEIHHHQKDTSHLLRSILYYILIKLNREFCRYHHLQADTQVNTHAFLFKEALEKHIRQKQQVNEYSALLGLSRIALNTSVVKQFGITASEMIRQRLLYEIFDELLFSDKTIAEIAYDLNFPEPHHLHRFFKRLTGQTPLEYKIAYQNGCH